ncbi:hypothetical protein D0962_30375 [Leptolyngbyaceae cyanobacterium CCMR0082]|uniref:Actin-like protein N-terminal domain-containing protein n=1 Tax=Adonisia turfae CCMR0082 TaxID=2304604 RepID=A0A6M0SET0_9CYAN|nr:hypothetical protein [Adonisia turfae]NEZ67008.1 hypothetical protein [Adonisia turfae CCMR0082]
MVTSLWPPKLLLACDLGKSGGKFFYKLSQGQTQALWMDAEVAQRPASGIGRINHGGRPQDNAWYRLGDELTFVGKSARAFLEYNSFKKDKFLKAPERIAAALGAIATAENLPSKFDAVVWILLPINELGTRQQIADRLMQLCQGFRFHNEQDYKVRLQLKFRPEGYGIYVQRKQQLQQQGVAITQRTTWVEMLGHRNGTQLAFETGTLNGAKSTSKFPGFWETFEKAATAAGVSDADFEVLLTALDSENPNQYSVAKGQMVNFSDAMAQVETAYLAALDPHFNDHLIPSLATGKGDVVLAGGASYLMEQGLRQYFESRGLANRLSFAWDNQDSLSQLVREQLPETHEMGSIPMRMTDCFGLFQALLGEMTQLQGAA